MCVFVCLCVYAQVCVGVQNMDVHAHKARGHP